MSQFKIAMKKDSMRKNKKLVINIAINKEGLASTGLEADQELGSLREEKERINEVKAIDDHHHHSSIKDGIMREVDVGAGLAGALNRLREQGTFKKKSKVVGVKENRKVDRFRDGFEDIQIVRRDEWGREMTPKEAFRALSHAFHGKKPGKRKLEKRKKKLEDDSKGMEYSDRTVERMRQVHAVLNCIRASKSMNANTKRACLVTSTSSRNTQLCSENLEDRISWLDENVLSKILSHLSTVEAVSTSVLSKAWRNIWTNVTELQFDDSSYRDPKDYRFTEFVERVLRDVGSPRINSFQLHSVNSYDETRLLSWLSKVLRRKLQKLVITGYGSESVNLSPIFASLDSLVELRLHTSSILDISAPTVFPNLKYFSLEEARIFNMSSISHNLVLNFPVLETFAAYYCRFFKTDTLIIDSPLLKTFEVFKCSREHVPNPNEVFKISVSALKLEKVTFSGDGSQRIRLFFPPSLPYAYLSLSRRWSKKFLHSFTSVTCLGIEISKSFEVNEVPLFSQLVYLSLTYNLNDHKILRQFLESAPRLEMFSIRDKKTPRATLTTKSMKELRSETAPDCIRTMLTVLQIRDFKMHEPQVSMLRHVMENAEILRSVILTTSNPITDKAKARILSFPKASPHASVFFE